MLIQKHIQLFNNSCGCNMVRNRDFSFRLFYRVAFFFFCLLFVCFYRGDRGFGLITGEIKTGSRKLREEFNDTPSTRKISNESIPDTTENSEQIDVDKTEEETGLQEIRKEIAVETKRSYEIGKKQVVPFSTSSLPKWKYPTMKPGIIAHVNQTKWDNYIKMNLYSLSRRFSHPYNFSTRQHNRNRRHIDAITRNKTGLIDCANSTFTIKYEDDYRVWNNFSIMYQGKIYHYDQYRVTKEGLEVCNSSKPLMQLRWQNLTIIEKEKMASRHCNVSVDGFPRPDYNVYKNLTVFFKLTKQNFLQTDYGVIFGRLAICSAKLSLSCDDYLIKVKYGGQYQIWKNFSLSYNNKIYNYSEYRFNYESIEMCASDDSKIPTIWRSRNSWENVKDRYKCLAQGDHYIKRPFYIYNIQINITVLRSGQYLTGHDYEVKDGEPFVCEGRLRPETTESTKEDLLSCNDSIISIKYDDEYKVWNNFSILYKNKVYDYTEYRVLNDIIKICNSSDDDVRNIWKIRNRWVKRVRSFKICNEAFRLNKYYVVSKQFHIFWAHSCQYFKKNRYGVVDGKPYVCTKIIKWNCVSTKEYLLTCQDSIINIKYDDEYKVWNNFSILYKNKVYDYTEYRVLNDTIKICNSTDDHERNIWKMRNYWIKWGMSLEACNEDLQLFYYVVSKQFELYSAANAQYLARNDYGVVRGRPYMCKRKLRPVSTEYTKEDLLTCNDSIINIKYDDEYKIWQKRNFSLLYKNKVYDYTEYRVLNDTIKICNSTDDYVRKIWKMRNYCVKLFTYFEICDESIITKTKRGYFSLLKNVRLQEITKTYKRGDFSFFAKPDWQNITKSKSPGNISVLEMEKLQKTLEELKRKFPTLLRDVKLRRSPMTYGVVEGKFISCDKKRIERNISDIRLSFIAPFCALALSIICLLLLLIVYGMLPELRTLPGLNLMSLSISFLLALINYVVYLSLYLRVGKELDFPCARMEIINRFITYNILMNAAVNIYHLRKTFCRNTLVRSDVNKLKTFFKYSLFGWGVPVVITIVYIVLVKTGILRFHQNTLGSVSCVKDHIFPSWLVVVENYSVPGCLLLYIITMFIFTAYRIRKKLRASNSIVQRSNIVKNRRSFFLLFKLSTTTAISWIPLVFEDLVFNSDLMIALLTVAWLTGVYVGIAFVFTRKNYQLLRKKYFSEQVSK
ncbi:uncharacterized protein LOC114519254 [Dendronephthya gigantea]|uniref:uncharacterized protein LOC114519254 n=1 Tax=Dendronephthya gigantea TaxID=151771 RepID=UPI00106BC8FA|nr:uncharacterized protein LOC114519254 [Dendronephthya gigantea]